jgi:D-3-phosphoglycerate dehydrogenase
MDTPVGCLHGETLGIVGLGRIGRALARRAAAMEFKLLACDPYIPQSVFEEYGATPVSLDELLRKSDYVSVHCPHTEETEHMFNEETLRKMKPSAYLVNTARGPVVENAAVAKALEEGWIAGAALDVMEVEPPPDAEPLLKMDNVVLTPHIAYYSDAAVAGLPRRCGLEVARVLTGKMPGSLVNPEVLEKQPLSSE